MLPAVQCSKLSHSLPICSLCFVPRKPACHRSEHALEPDTFRVHVPDQPLCVPGAPQRHVFDKLTADSIMSDTL